MVMVVATTREEEKEEDGGGQKVRERAGLCIRVCIYDRADIYVADGTEHMDNL